MSFRKGVLILAYYFITCITDISLGQLSNCFGRVGSSCFDQGFSACSEGSSDCNSRLNQAQSNYQQALSQLYQYNQEIANLTDEKARCNVQIESCTSSIQVKNNEAAQCNKQLKDNMANMNLAVTQNVRTTITDLSTETRYCIRLTQPECRGQSSTCFWDASLTVTGQQGKGACISARFE